MFSVLKFDFRRYEVMLVDCVTSLHQKHTIIVHLDGNKFIFDTRTVHKNDCEKSSL